MTAVIRVESLGRGIYIRCPTTRGPRPSRLVPFGRTGGVAAHRADYRVEDADAIVEWLRERAEGYLVPPRLLHLVRL